MKQSKLISDFPLKYTQQANLCFSEKPYRKHKSLLFLNNLAKKIKQCLKLTQALISKLGILTYNKICTNLTI